MNRLNLNPHIGLIWSTLLACAAALGAGAGNAIAGGGTLLTFPALLAIVNPISANATSTMALLPGSLSAGLGYRTELRRARHHLVLLWPPSLVGGILGALLLIRMPEQVFVSMVPWLLVGASLLLLFQRPLAKYIITHPHQRPGRRRVAAVVFFQLLVGIYGGYFGAGAGIMMLSALGFMGVTDIHEMNALKSILGATMNGISAVLFAVAGVVAWPYASVMAIAAILGGYGGARFARRLKQEYVRLIVVTVGLLLAAWSYASM